MHERFTSKVRTCTSFWDARELCVTIMCFAIATIMNRPFCTVNKICQVIREEGSLFNLPRGHRQHVMDSANDQSRSFVLKQLKQT